MPKNLFTIPMHTTKMNNKEGYLLELYRLEIYIEKRIQYNNLSIE